MGWNNNQNREADTLAMIVMSHGGEMRVTKKQWQELALKLHLGYAVDVRVDKDTEDVVVRIQLV